MDNLTISLKIKLRLNKLASNDYDNIPDWQIIEAFNKGVVNWCRRNLAGTNILKEGDEASKRRIDDLQILLTPSPIKLNKKDLFYESDPLPTNYMEWKRISVKASADCCNKKPMVVYLAEEANVDNLLRDDLKNPNIEWGETFCTLINNKIRVYTNNDFDLSDAVLTYYRQPRKIEIQGVSNPYTGTISTTDVTCEFKDDLVEVFIDEAAKILASDIESITQVQINNESVENNN